MADEFQTGVCGENWWNSSRTTTAFGWPLDFVDMKARSSTTDECSDGSVLLFHDMQNPHQSIALSSSSSSPTTDYWNQSLLHVSGRAESNLMLQEDLNSSFNYRQDSFVNGLKPMNQGFSLGHQPLNSVAGGDECTETSQGLDTSFPLSSDSCGYPSTLLQTLFDTDSEPQEPLFDNQSMNYPSTTNNYRKRLNEFSSSMHKFSSLQKQQAPSLLHLSKDTPLWTASAGAPNDIRPSLFPSMQSQFIPSTFEQKPNCPNLTAKPNNEEVGDSGMVVKKSSSEPAFKRPRIETPSPLPTFKVRKEKLGDRITALQQLVSPFGKTDTASVLHEAIDYIKLLHDQVSVLSTPYMNNGGPPQRQQNPNKLKDSEGTKQDLKSRGLCLVPISSTFPVAAETTDFWAPTFGGYIQQIKVGMINMMSWKSHWCVQSDP